MARTRGWVLRGLRSLEEAIELLRRRLAPPELTLFRDVTAPWLASALCLASRLRLSEHLGEERLELCDLAARTGVGTPQLGRFLAVLSSHGYFALDANGRVCATRLSRALARDRAGSFVEMQGRGWYRGAFLSSHVLQGWSRGQTPFEVATGQPFFDYLDADPPASDLFSAAMADITRFCVPFFVDMFELRPGEKLLDVGGGDGELARALVRRHPGCEIAVLDRAGSSQGGQRVVFHHGDFFQQLPSGYDRLVLKNILHDWDDDRATALLARCREAVELGGRLTVIECLLPEPGRPLERHAQALALDWNVWLTLSGQERSESDYRRLLEAAGWRLSGCRPTATPYVFLEAVAV